jgi:hypothetical protein
MPDHFHIKYDLCTHSSALIEDGQTHYLVTGLIRIEEHYEECMRMREHSELCGREGRYFEPLPPKIPFWRTALNKVMR